MARREDTSETMGTALWTSSAVEYARAAGCSPPHRRVSLGPGNLMHRADEDGREAAARRPRP